MVAQQNLTTCFIEEHVHGDGIVELRLNRPRALNAFSSEMYLQVAEKLNQYSSRSDIRIVLVTANGPTFCAGMDIREVSRAKDIREVTSAAHTFMNALMDCPHITIAAVFGHNVGIGVTMLLHFDLVLAHSASCFETPFPSTGIVPEFASSFLFPHMLGISLTYRLLLRGECVSAGEMQQTGVLQIVNSDVRKEALGHAKAWSQSMSEKQWIMVEASKELIRNPLRERARQVMQLEFEAIFHAQESGISSELVSEKVQKVFTRRAKL